MQASLRALLTGLIDYAGLFPPAKLPLDQAVTQYAHYRQEPEGWMLGRFVCPTARLGELAPFIETLFREGPPLAITATGRGGADLAGYLKAQTDDLADLAAFASRHGDRVVVDAVEVRLPSALHANAVEYIRPWTQAKGARLKAVHVESNLKEDWRRTVPAIIAAVKEAAPGRAGYKLRCGGLEASAFPGVEQVAFVVHACREARVPLKFTAGLHHPLRRFDPDIGVHSHGFVNVFVAGVLARVHGLSEDRLREVIADEDAAHFTFTDEGMRWNDLHTSTEQIGPARRDAVTSFGSCSIDEPCDDLRALGWL